MIFVDLKRWYKMNMRFAKFDADIAKNDPTVAKLRSRIFDYVFGKTQFGIKKLSVTGR